jgi:hypothetical protein
VADHSEAELKRAYELFAAAGATRMDSPQLGALFFQLDRLRQGEPAAAEARRAAHEAIAFFREVRRVAAQKLRFREPSPVFDQQGPVAMRSMEKLVDDLEQTERALDGADATMLVGWRDRIEKHFEQLMAALAAIEEEDKTLPQHSQSPLVNQLMRVALAVSERRMKRELLGDALAEMLAHHRHFVTDLERHVRAGAEAREFDDKRAELYGLLHSLERNFAEAQKVFNEGKTSEVIDILRRCCVEADRLLAVQQEFAALARAARQARCLQCGAPLESGARQCTSCGAQRPPIAPAIAVPDDGSSHARTELSIRLEEAVRDMQLRRMSAASFRQFTDELTQRLEAWQTQLSSMQLPTDVPPEESKRLRGTADALLTGISQMLDGVARLERFLEDGNVSHLELGLELALTGADKIHAVRSLANAVAPPPNT